MNTCDTCKHWSGLDLPDDRFKICQKLESARNGEEWESVVVFAGSSDDDRNTIHTGPKFGCIHHEWNQAPKELLEQLVWEIFKSKGMDVSPEICEEVVSEVAGFTSTTEEIS